MQYWTRGRFVASLGTTFTQGARPRDCLADGKLYRTPTLESQNNRETLACRHVCGLDWHHHRPQCTASSRENDTPPSVDVRVQSDHAHVGVAREIWDLIANLEWPRLRARSTGLLTQAVLVFPRHSYAADVAVLS